MTKIFLVRHAEAEGNIYRRAHGHYNGLVTLKGMKQIKLLEERLSGGQIDAVYSSDLSRAVSTAMAVSKPRSLQITADKALREVDLGCWEDRAWGEIDYSDYDMIVYFNDDPAKWQVDGSEPYENVINRVYGYIREIADKHSGETIAVFSHGFAIRAYLCKLRGIPSHETKSVPYCDNTAVTLIYYENGEFRIEYAGDNSHLTGRNSTLQQQSWWKAGEKRKPENLRYLPLSEVAPESLIDIFKTKAGERAHADTQYAAFLADEPVAVLGLDTHREAERKAGWISYLHVAAHHRKNNFGVQLLGTAVSDFRKLGREKLRVELPAGSPYISFMEKYGFDVILTTETLCQMEKDIRNW